MRSTEKSLELISKINSSDFIRKHRILHLVFCQIEEVMESEILFEDPCCYELRFSNFRFVISQEFRN